MIKDSLSNIFDIQIANYRTYITAIAINEFDIFSLLDEEPSTISQLSRKLSIKERPAEAMLNACTALGLLEKKEEKYAPTNLSEKFLIKGKPYYVGDLFKLVGEDTYSQLKKAIISNDKQIYGEEDTWEAHQLDENKVRFFTEAMHGLSVVPGENIAKEIDFSDRHNILDIGGGSGAIPIMIASHHPHIETVIFDIPPVCQIAEEFIEKAGLSDKITTHSGNFFKDPLPDGFDTAILSNILHDWDEATCDQLLKKIFNSLPKNGLLVINESILNSDKSSPLFTSLYSLGMLVWTEGRQYSKDEITSMLSSNGFSNIQIKPIEGYYSIITAVK